MGTIADVAKVCGSSSSAPPTMAERRIITSASPDCAGAGEATGNSSGGRGGPGFHGLRAGGGQGGRGAELVGEWLHGGVAHFVGVAHADGYPVGGLAGAGREQPRRDCGDVWSAPQHFLIK